MPVIKNNTNRVLTLADFNGNYVEVGPAGELESPYFYTTISGADVVTEAPYYQDVLQYASATGDVSTDYTMDILYTVNKLEVSNSTDGDILVYLNSKTTNPYVVMKSDKAVIHNIQDRVRRLYVDFSATVTAGVNVCGYGEVI